MGVAGKMFRFSLALLAICSLRAAEQPVPSAESLAAQIAELRAVVAAQQKQIDELRAAVAGPQPQAASAVTADTNAIRAQTAGASAENPSAPPGGTLTQAGASGDELTHRVEELSRGLAGFRFSGDFRYRIDMQARSANDLAGPLQNIRSRYRLRLNVDKDLDRRFSFHVQLSTGPYNVQTTNDQDMAGMAVKHPFSIAEGYIDFHPHRNFSMRGGRMEEVFADNMRFLWDDDVRFNGFHQILRVPFRSSLLGFRTVEFRAGEYFLSNPNVTVLPANSPYTGAGEQVGQKVRDANLFHPGFILMGNLSERWTQQLFSDIQLYRNPNQIQLSSTAAGAGVVVNPALGLTLSGPIPTVGTATTTPGGAMYYAPHFQIVRLGYHVERKGLTWRGREMPVWLDVQGSRNVGTSKFRDGMMASVNVGAARRFGDMRFLYQFAIKDPNALISQFTDDDLGTGLTTNIRVHAIRFDLGLTRYLQWQNLFFLQTERRANNPAEHFFVPVPHGANETYRYLGQLAFTF